uniref:DDE_Tnp_1_7 domain-containing protein n=1 Tax=Syphacia muris TaxID=451379 RepID=A0A0N5AM82_9BILA
MSKKYTIAGRITILMSVNCPEEGWIYTRKSNLRANTNHGVFAFFVLVNFVAIITDELLSDCGLTVVVDEYSCWFKCCQALQQDDTVSFYSAKFTIRFLRYLLMSVIRAMRPSLARFNDDFRTSDDRK